MTTSSPNAVLARWNSLDAESAARGILPCCSSTAWAVGLASQRPFADVQQLLLASDQVWAALPESGWQEAFDSHPRIGQQHARAAPTVESLAMSSARAARRHVRMRTPLSLPSPKETGSMKRFGRIFHRVCFGQERGGDPRDPQRAHEQRCRGGVARSRRTATPDHAITPSPMAGSRLNSMGISTHILDTALGRPAARSHCTLVSFPRQSSGSTLLREIKTDADGRCRQLLPEGAALEAGLYRIRFETAAYYEAGRLAGLYPYIEIVFEVRDSEQHYHIPLLLTANGYTTYRGS